MIPTIGRTETGQAIVIDVRRLLVSRLLLQADSGGGKTVALKRLLEQTHPHVQQIIIDPEGEFSTLREKFDYILCAPDGADAIANPKTARILARKLRETRISAVIDIFDLKPQEQKQFVRYFVEELMVAPKSLWNPCMVVIDEAQVFAPENDKAESLDAVMGPARQRPQALHWKIPKGALKDDVLRYFGPCPHGTTNDFLWVREPFYLGTCWCLSFEVIRANIDQVLKEAA